MLVRVEFGIRFLMSINGFANNISNSFGRITILLQHFGNFLTLKKQQLSIAAILIALLTNDLMKIILYLEGAKLLHLLYSPVWVGFL